MADLKEDDVKLLKNKVIEKIKTCDDECMSMIASASIGIFDIYIHYNNESEKNLFLRKRFLGKFNRKLKFDIFSMIPESYIEEIRPKLSVTLKVDKELEDLEFNKFKPYFVTSNKTEKFYPNSKEELNLFNDIDFFPSFFSKDFSEKLKFYQCVISGGFAIALVTRNFKSLGFSDIDVFSKSLDFLRWFINEHRNLISTIKIKYFKGYMTTYNVYFKNTHGLYLNFIHMKTDLSEYRIVKSKKHGISFSNIDVDYKDKPFPESMLPEDIRPQKGDQEEIMDILTKTFDISCCCTYYDGTHVHYNEETKKMNADGIGLYYRKSKYIGKGFKFESWIDFKNRIYEPDLKSVTDDKSQKDEKSEESVTDDDSE